MTTPIHDYSYHVAQELVALIPGKFDYFYGFIDKHFQVTGDADTMVIVHTENLFDDKQYKWGSKAHPCTEDLIAQIDRHPNKRFIIFTSLEYFEKELKTQNKNVYIVPIGGDITKQYHKYPLTNPQIEKDFNSKKSFVFFNNKRRHSRVLGASYVYGLELDKFGTITLLDPSYNMYYLDSIPWPFEPRHYYDQQILDRGSIRIQQSNVVGEKYIHFPSDKDDKMGFTPDQYGNWLKLRPLHKNSFIEIIGETTFAETAIFINEKYQNSVYGCEFPIILGCSGTVSFLRNFGFDVFDDVINHSYDLIEHPIDRAIAAINMNKDLLQDVDRVKSLWAERQDRFLANIDFIRNGMYIKYRDRARRIFFELGLDK